MLEYYYYFLIFNLFFLVKMFVFNYKVKHMNYINYLQHQITLSDLSFREFSFDFDSEALKANQVNISRVMNAALPIFSCSELLATPIFYTSSSFRIYSDMKSCYRDCLAGKWENLPLDLIKLMLTVGAVASTYFNYELGHMVGSLSDIVASLHELIHHLLNENYAKAFDSLITLTSSILYCVIHFHASLEIHLLLTLIQSLHNFKNGFEEFCEGRYLECFSKIIMGGIKCNNAHEIYINIEKRNELEKQFQFLKEEIEDYFQTLHLLNSPIEISSEGEAIVHNCNGQSINLGKHYFAMGSSFVKGETLSFRTQINNGKQSTVIDFKLTKPFRIELEKRLKQLKNANSHDINTYLNLNQMPIHIDIKEGEFPISQLYAMPSAYIVDFTSIGRVYIGSSPNNLGTYDRIKVELKEGATLYNLHGMLSILGLKQTLYTSSFEDIERLKIAKLFRTYFPTIAYEMEKEKSFYLESPSCLQEKIIAKEPAMQEIFERSLDSMRLEETLPGKVHFALPSLVDEIKTEGAVALTTALTGVYDMKMLARRLADIFKVGMLSTEARFDSGINLAGASSYYDFKVGGNESVYTQLITQSDIERNKSFLEYAYQSPVRLILDLDPLSMGSYQYYYDSFGSKNPAYYANRDSIFTYVKNKLKMQSCWDSSEVMLKERVSAQHIRSIVVKNEGAKKELIAQLKILKAIDAEGRVCGKKIEDLIIVGNSLSDLFH